MAKIYQRTLLTQAQYKTLVAETPVPDLDILVQKYRFKSGYKKFNETDMIIICNWFDVFLNSTRGSYGYNIKSAYRIRLCRSLLTAFINNNMFEQVLNYMYTHNKLQKQHLSYLYRLMSFKKRMATCNYFLKILYADTYVDIELTEPLLRCIDRKIFNSPYNTFNKLIASCTLNSRATIDITPQLFQILVFDDYKHKFCNIAEILYNNNKYHLLNKDEYTKHWDQLIKTAYYQRTVGVEIESFLRHAPFLNKEEREKLESVALMKKIL